MHFLNVYMALWLCTAQTGLGYWFTSTIVDSHYDWLDPVADLHPSMAVTLHISKLAGKATL